jgi:23S rRNA pseudouridine2604 synthase
MSTKPAAKAAAKKPTLTLAKSVAKRVADTTSAGTGRSHSTRAKQAARRDGRELPVVRVKVKDPLIAATPTVSSESKDYRSKSTASSKPREPESQGQRRPREGDARRPSPSAYRGEPRDNRNSARPTGKFGERTDRTPTRTPAPAKPSGGAGPRETAESRTFVPRPAGRRSTGTGTGNTRGAPTGDRAQVARIDGKTGRYDGKRENKPFTKAPSAPVGAASAAPAREPDGMIRVSKLLSEQGLCSRREADSYIARGWVWADGERVTELGTRVLPTAKLTLDQHAAMMQDQRVTILLNKPVGYVSGQAEDGYQPASVLITAETQIETDEERFQHINRRGLAPAGRLDIDSTGLLVLTQDGRIAKQLVGENSPVEKEYLVRVEGKLAPGDLERLRHGLELDGEALKPAKVKWQNADQLNFILQEGKKRQIRRMCEMVGLKVVGLKRIRIGNVLLGDLPPGKWRFLRGNESFL